MKQLFTWLCAAGLLLFSTEARAQCRIEGTVLSAAGAPLADATVQVTGPDMRTPLSGQTDRDGHYAIKDVQAGLRVKVSVSAGNRPVAVAYGLVTSWVETIDIKLPAEVSTPTTAADLDPSGGASGEVRGIVRGSDGASIAGARVAIEDTPVAAVTDSSGRFSFGKVRAGLALQLRVAADGYETATENVSVPGSGAADVDFALGAGKAPDPNDTQSALQELSRTARFLTPRFTSSDPPATPYEGFQWYPFSRLFVDLGGLNPEPLAAIPSVSQPTGDVEASAFGTSGHVTLPVSHRGTLLLAARRSLPGALYGDVLDVFDGGTGTAVRDRAPRDSTGVFPVRPAPGFSDVNARLLLAPGRNNRLTVSVYDARDEENYSRDQTLGSLSDAIAIPDPTTLQLPSDARIQAGDAQSWTGRGMSASWARDWSPAVTTTASVGRSRFSKTHDQGFFLTSPLTGVDYAVPAGRDTSAGLSEQNEIDDTTVKIDASIRFGFRHAVDIGGEVASLDAQTTAFTEASRPTPSVTRGAIAPVPLLQRNTTGKTLTLFGQDTWRPAGRLVLSPGVRLIHYDVAGTSYVDPRVAASYPVAPRTELNASWSIDHQIASRITREDREHGDGDFWILADGSQIPVSRVQQINGGVSVDAPGVRFDARLFYKRLNDVTLFAPRLLPGVAPSAGPSAFYQGSGTSAGLELSVEQRAAWNGLRATYRLARTEYTYPSLEAGAFPASDDERHRFAVVEWLPIRAGVSVGAAWVVAQGRPVTPFDSVQQVWFPSGDLSYQATFGARNSSRLPAYQRLDLSGQIVHRFGLVSSTLGLTVFNVSNHENILFYDYEPVGSAESTSAIFMMRRAVNVFFKVGF